MIMYKEAVRGNYKFQTNVGELTVSQLFNASDDTLIKLEDSLKDQVKTSKKPNRFQGSGKKDKTLKTKLAIVSDVIDTIIEDRDNVVSEVNKKEKMQELLTEKSRRDKEGVKELSDDELDAKIKKLK